MEGEEEKEEEEEEEDCGCDYYFGSIHLCLSSSRRRLWRPWREKISPQRPLAATIKTNTLLQPPLSPPPPPPPPLLPPPPPVGLLLVLQCFHATFLPTVIYLNPFRRL